LKTAKITKRDITRITLTVNVLLLLLLDYSTGLG